MSCWQLLYTRLTDPRVAIPHVRLAYDQIPACKECAICIDETSRRSWVALARCHHAFHTHCIARWSRKSTTCPLCRQ